MYLAEDHCYKLAQKACVCCLESKIVTVVITIMFFSPSKMGLSTTTTAGQKSSTRSNRRSVGQDDASQASEDPNRIEDDDSFMDMVEGDERKKTGLFGALTNWK